MEKPTEQIMAWLATLSPADELAVRMALSLTNPWCSQDRPWQLRIAALQSQFIRCDADRQRYEERATKIAQDFTGAIEAMKAQAAIPAAAPSVPA